MVLHLLTEEPEGLPDAVRDALMMCMPNLSTPLCSTSSPDAFRTLKSALFANAGITSVSVCVLLDESTMQQLPGCDRTASEEATLKSATQALAMQLGILSATFLQLDDLVAVCFQGLDTVALHSVFFPNCAEKPQHCAGGVPDAQAECKMAAPVHT